MAVHIDPQTRDEVRAELALVTERLDEVAAEAEGLDDEVIRDDLLDRVARIKHRAAHLGEAVKGDPQPWEAIHVIVDDLPAAVDALELDLEAARAEPGDLRAVLDHQLREWRARLDRLSLQASLGEMNARDEFAGLASRAAGLRRVLLSSLQEFGDDATTLAEHLRADIFELVNDSARAVERTIDAVTAPAEEVDESDEE